MAKAKKEAEPETPEGEDESAEQPKKKLPLKLIIIGVVGLLVVGGGGTAGYLMLAGGKHEEKVTTPAPKPVAFFELPDVTVNLATTGNERTQYLRLKIVLELPDATLVPLVQPLLPRVIDAFQTYLRELRSSDLDGSAGLYRLRDELTRRVNVAVAPTRINAVLFKEIVVQ